MTNPMPRRGLSIIAHQGYSLVKEDKNTEIAVRHAFQHGFGVEVDLFPIGTTGVAISKGPVSDHGTYFTLEQLLDLRLQYPDAGPIMLDIKMGRIRHHVARILASASYAALEIGIFGVENPSDTIHYAKDPGHIYAMTSDYRPLDISRLTRRINVSRLSKQFNTSRLAKLLNFRTPGELDKKAKGFWVEDFEYHSSKLNSEIWRTAELHLSNGKDLTIALLDVTNPDLEIHGRKAHQAQLEELAPKLHILESRYPERSLSICTNDVVFAQKTLSLAA